MRLRGAADRGFTLVELVVVTAVLMVIVGGCLAVLDGATSAEARDVSYAQEISATQTLLARLVHDLRQATAFQLVSPNAVQFQVTLRGTTYNVKYDCTAPDSLGTPYTRCARTQAAAPAAPPAAGAMPGPADIQHVRNGAIATFCTSDGTAQSGSVFFVSNPNVADTDGSTAACDEAYENLIGPQLHLPTYVQVLVQVPAGGDLARGGLTHTTVLKSGAFLPNSDAGA
jgi:type II secretory pathway pseudopilin PulG